MCCVVGASLLTLAVFGGIAPAAWTGVPARRDQPDCNGPSAANTTVATTNPAVATKPNWRRSAGRDICSRNPTVAATTATHAASSARSHGSRLSVPVPRPCQRAIGQHAYASQCTARQAIYGNRVRIRLVMMSASSKSKAMVPRLSHSGRYAELNGMTAETKPIPANGSSTAVMMCTATNATASSERLRCRPARTMPETARVSMRAVPATPSATVTVSNTSATTPVALVVYQSGLGPDVPTASAWLAVAAFRGCSALAAPIMIRPSSRPVAPASVRAAAAAERAPTRDGCGAVGWCWRSARQPGRWRPDRPSPMSECLRPASAGSSLASWPRDQGARARRPCPSRAMRPRRRRRPRASACGYGPACHRVARTQHAFARTQHAGDHAYRGPSPRGDLPYRTWRPDGRVPQLALPPVDDRFRNRSELVNHDQPADHPGRETDFSGVIRPAVSAGGSSNPMASRLLRAGGVRVAGYAPGGRLAGQSSRSGRHQEYPTRRQYRRWRR